MTHDGYKKSMDPSPEPLSTSLELWRTSDIPKDLDHLVSIFGERGLLILICMLLFPAALPLPTGGFTHLFEIIAVIPTIQLITGRTHALLPGRIRRITLSATFMNRLLPRTIRIIRWIEHHSRPRSAKFLARQPVQSAVGVILLLFLAGAFLAPPFSGLDTLPAMGATIMTLGLLLRDRIVVLAGLGLGALGWTLLILLGSFVMHLLG